MKYTQLWAKMLLPVLGIRIHCISKINMKNLSGMIISNHQSYLDILIIASLFPSLFVAKKEVKSWPILGWLASLGKTVFVDRNSFRGTSVAVDEVGKALLKKNNLVIFPEGTSTHGNSVLPFRSSFFTAATQTQSHLIPVSISYTYINEKVKNETNRDIVCWYGSMTFVDHFWKFLHQKSIDVSVIIHPAEKCQLMDDAKVLAKKFHEIIKQPLSEKQSTFQIHEDHTFAAAV